MKLEQFVNEIVSRKQSYIRIQGSKGVGYDDAEDLYQGFALFVIKKDLGEKYDPKRSSLDNFIGTCFNNYCRGENSKKFADKRAPDRAIHLLEDIPTTESLKESPFEEAIENALKLLNQKYKQIIEMKYFQGMEFSDIAEDMGITVDAIRERARVAYRKIEGQLREDLLSLGIHLRYKLS